MVSPQSRDSKDLSDLQDHVLERAKERGQSGKSLRPSQPHEEVNVKRQRGKLAILPILVALCSLTSLAKDRDWTTGTLVASEMERETRIVTIPPVVGSRQSAPMIATVPNDLTLYTIDDGKYVFVVSRQIMRPLKLTVNTPVKFAIEKRYCYLLDEEGKEHKLLVEKKTLKTN